MGRSVGSDGAMKGISPMIAVVLLIAFTVAVGGLLSVWFSTLTTSQTATVQASGETLAKCAQNSLEITSVKFLSSWSSRTVNVTITSSGTQNVKNVTFTVVGGGVSTTSIKFFNASGDDLLPGLSFATSMNASNITIIPEFVTVSALCIDRAITAECSTGQACMKPV